MENREPKISILLFWRVYYFTQDKMSMILRDEELEFDLRGDIDNL